MDGLDEEWIGLPKAWVADAIAINALQSAGLLGPGETPSPELRAYVGELMDRCKTFGELFAELMPRYPIELQANPDEELTLP